MKKLLLLFALAGVLWACNTNDASNGATFKFRINSLTPYEADVSVKPSNNNIYYYFDIEDVTYLTTYYSSLEEYVDEADLYYFSQKGTYEQLIADATLSKGVDSYVVYLNYYLYLCTRFASKGWIKADLMLVYTP